MLLRHIAVRPDCQSPRHRGLAQLAGQDQHPQARVGTQQIGGQRDAVSVGQTDIDDRDHGLLLGDHPARGGHRARLADQDKVTLQRQQHAQTVADQRMILDDDH